MNIDTHSLSHPKSGTPSNSFIYFDADGSPLLIANRYDKSDGGKYFMPYDVQSGTWKAPAIRPLYNLHKITSADPSIPIIIVEGEKCADALGELGFLATTTFGGSNAPKKTDLRPLAARHIFIWPDHDEAGQKYEKSLKELLGKNITNHIVSLPIGSVWCMKFIEKIENSRFFKGWDAADAVAQGWSKADVENLLQTAQNVANNGTTLPKDAQNYTPQQSAILADIELWHTPQKDTFATISTNGHQEHWPLESAYFREFLSYQHYQSEGKMLSQSALEDQRRMFFGKAIFDGEQHPVFNRIGEIGRTLYVDLGTPDWSAVAVTAEGWEVIKHPTARFRRAVSQQQLPLPCHGKGNIDLLRPFVNVATEDDFRMLVAWLVGCFHPRGPYPILILNGEQGSAKSTTARVLRSLVDPANPIARSAPNSEQDLVISARNNHVLAFDNISTIKPAMSDALCRIATGGGFGTRKLHTDQDEILFSATRPCLLNGIPDLASRPDLADRSIIVTLPVISPSERKFEGEFNKALDKAAPYILAGLLDAVSIALRNLGSVELIERPRMADFAKWVTAAEPALGWPAGAFMDSYEVNRGTADRASVEGNPVALAILKLVTETVIWSGTMTDLKTTLQNRYPRLTDDPIGFPKQENKLSSVIRRVQPPLRRMGVSIAFDRQGKSGERILKLSRS